MSMSMVSPYNGRGLYVSAPGAKVVVRCPVPGAAAWAEAKLRAALSQKIVVEADLIDALKSGHLAGAALDTLCTEPLPADSPLIGVKNLLITPHIAGAAYDVQACGTQLTAASLTAWLEGRQPAMRVA